MNRITRNVLIGAGFFATFAVTAASAQQPPQQPVRVRGEITKVDGNVFMVKARDGAELKVTTPDDLRVMALVKASLADVKPGSYIGVTAMPQSDGSQRAIAIHIFTEAQRGTAEGHTPWDLRPHSTMTNAAVDTTVAGVDGQVVTVKYKDGEKKVVVPAETPIVAYAPGDKSELKPGAKVIIMRATRQPDGSLQAPAINVGRDGIAPPM